jgi:ABC-type Na+ efflux pump permease subunit
MSYTRFALSRWVVRPMSSWRLLQHLIVFWNAVDNPIFMRETRRLPVWHDVYTRISRATGLALMLGGLGCYLSTLLVFYLNNLLILLVPFLFFWTLLLGLTLAPTVVEEREQRTWETLRTTPLTIETILLGKMGGALWWLRDVIRAVSGLLLLVAAGIGLVSLVLAPANSTASLPHVLCAAAVALPLISAAAFVIDRAQQFVLTVVAALAAGTSARSVRIALAASSTAALGVWLADVGVAVLLISFQPQQIATTSLSELVGLLTLGPMAGYLTRLSIGTTVLYVTLTLVAREVAIRLLWHWTIRAATTM